MKSPAWVVLVPFTVALALAGPPGRSEEALPGGEAPREERLGRVEFPNSGAPEAQEAFLGGLAALHSFFYDEAADLFREAQGRDPDFALAYWGEAMTYNHPIWQEVDLEAARGVLGRLGETPAERAAKAGTLIEKGFLATVEVLFGEGTKDERDRAYSEALARLRETHPDHHEAAAFYALSLQGLARPGEIDPRLQVRSAAILEEVFDANPLHPGAAHYLIHAYDDPVHAPLGLRPARVYAEIAPAAPHALHMPSHIFVQLGMWKRAALSNQAAYAASVDWVERRGHALDKRDYHSLSWLQYALLQMGRVEEAEATLVEVRRVLEREPSEHVRNVLAGMLARQAVETGRFGEGVEAGGEVAVTHCGNPARVAGMVDPTAALVFARGYVAAREGDVEAAEAAARDLAGRAAEAGADGAGGHRARGLRVRQLELEALVALARGDGEGARARLADAVELEEALGTPSGPPHPEKPALELLGEVLLELGRPAEAMEAFERSLRRTPERAASVQGAARAAAARGRAAAGREGVEVGAWGVVPSPAAGAATTYLSPRVR